MSRFEKVYLFNLNTTEKVYKKKSFLAKSHKNIEITPEFYNKVGAISFFL